MKMFAKCIHKFRPLKEGLKECALCGRVAKAPIPKRKQPKPQKPRERGRHNSLTVSEAAEILGLTTHQVSIRKQYGSLWGDKGFIDKDAIEHYLKKPYKDKSSRRKGVYEHKTARSVAILNRHRIVTG